MTTKGGYLLRNVKTPVLKVLGKRKREEDDEDDEIMEFIEEYMDIDPEIVDRYRTQIVEIMRSIRKKEITLEKLLGSDLRIQDKSQLFELIGIYNSMMEVSEDRIMLREHIYRLFEFYKKNTDIQKKIEEFMPDSVSELSELSEQIYHLETSPENKNVLYRKFIELKQSPSQDEEYHKMKNWIRWAVAIPHDRLYVFPDKTSVFLENAKKQMDRFLYGMDRVKEQILLLIHTKLVNPEIRGCNLGLVGDPGVGKTSIARCMAQIMEMPFEQISLGGIHHPDFLKGYDYTYVGSKPGEIVRCLTRMKSKNGILFLDEFDKISENHEMISSLLHITDFTQNHTYRDNYLSDLTIDLSSLWFIYSMNELPTNSALRDRLFIIRVDGYSMQEKIHIVRYYVIPKILNSLNRTKDDVMITDEVIRYIICKMGDDTNRGIREIERIMRDLLVRIDFNVHYPTINTSFQTRMSYPLDITTEMVEKILKSPNTVRPYSSMYL
jgi:ATP-dependent Lon protease